MTPEEDRLHTRVKALPQKLLCEADKRLDGLIVAEEGRQKLLEDKAARYFVNASGLSAAVAGVVAIMAKDLVAKDSQIEAVSWLNVYPLLVLIVLSISSAVVSAYSLTVFRAHTVPMINSDDIVPPSNLPAPKSRFYLVALVLQKKLIAEGMFKSNEQRGDCLRHTELAVRVSLSILITMLLPMLIPLSGWLLVYSR